MKISTELENNSKVDVTQLKELLVLVNQKVHKPKKMYFAALFNDEQPEIPSEEVHLLEFLMPNYAFKCRIVSAVGQQESAINKMLDIYNRHIKLILEVK